MQYSYQQVKEIREGLWFIVDKIKNDPKCASVLPRQELVAFEKAILEYDTALEKIGVGGYCSDPQINQGFKVTEDFVEKIKVTLKSLK